MNWYWWVLICWFGFNLLAPIVLWFVKTRNSKRNERKSIRAATVCSSFARWG
ncbi:MAG: hypothetical protein ABSE08_01730 [Syntrophobacteraceae bacterium]|jgi:hypothetical protein